MIPVKVIGEFVQKSLTVFDRVENSLGAARFENPLPDTASINQHLDDVMDHLDELRDLIYELKELIV